MQSHEKKERHGWTLEAWRLTTMAKSMKLKMSPKNLVIEPCTNTKVFRRRRISVRKNNTTTSLHATNKIK
jgi:hypothetical protein